VHLVLSKKRTGGKERRRRTGEEGRGRRTEETKDPLRGVRYGALAVESGGAGPMVGPLGV
jgi:hypothetical protein